MSRSLVNSSNIFRALLLAAVLVTAIATHAIDRAQPSTATLILREMPDPAGEMARAAQWLNDYYAAPEGLQRPGGLWLEGHPDYVGIGAWLFQSYLTARLSGDDEATARAAVIADIQQSPEWRNKHPGAAIPGR